MSKWKRCSPCVVHGPLGEGKKLFSRQGSILIAVLWSLFFLAALVLVIHTVVAPQIAVAARLRDRTVGHYLAQAGVRRALVEIKADETPAHDALNEPWSRGEEIFQEVRLEGIGTFSLVLTQDRARGELEEDAEPGFGLVDEERKININKASVEVLQRFFETEAALTLLEASDIAAAIVDWRDPDDEPSPNGAEAQYYASLDPAYPCKNADLDILEELLLVRGMTAPLYDRVETKLTVYGDGGVNINTAQAAVLESLGFSGALVEKILTYRRGNDGEEGTPDDNIFTQGESIQDTLRGKAGLSQEQSEELTLVLGQGLIGVGSHHFRGHVFAALPESPVTTDVVFVLDREGQVLYWHEE